MAIVGTAWICDSCNGAFELEKGRPTHCSKCGAAVGLKDYGVLNLPNYIHSQKRNLERTPKSQLDKTRAKNPRVRPEDLLSEIKEIDSACVQFFRKTGDTTRIACMHDSSMVVRELLNSNVSPEAAKRIIASAKMTGQMAEAVEKFLKSGGVFHDNETRRLQTGPGNPTGGQTPIG